MLGTAPHLRVLCGLHLVDDVAARRADFRKGMAALAARQRGADDAPLEGLSPDLLAESARAALSAQLFDDLDFLEPAAAASALYALASALPLGTERRELGKRVLGLVQDGHAGTFVQVARLVSLGSARAAEASPLRTRIALVHALPFGTSVEPDALASVLVARRELLAHYVVEASRGALWDRVLAARIVERAARDGVKRGPTRHGELKLVLEGDALRAALDRLVIDREPLVWRRAASARGLLASFSTLHAEDVERDLASEGSVSRLRRGACALAAQLPLREAVVLARAEQMLTGPLAQRDPGLGTAFLHGTAAVCALAPEATERMHTLCLEHGGREAAEALSALSREVARNLVSPEVRSAARVLLQRAHGRRSDDEGHNVHLDLVCEELGDTRASGPPSLLSLRDRALALFVLEGARAAHELARSALELSDGLVEELERTAERDDPAARRSEYRLIHTLDAAWLESSTLSDLLALGVQDSGTERARCSRLLSRLSHAILAHEREPHAGGEDVAHVTLRMRRLRALLHALDTDIRHDGEKTHAVRFQRFEKTAVLLRRVQRDESSAMDRIVHAALARSLESLVRDEAFEPSDVLLAVARYVPTAHGVLALADASMLPELRAILRAVARSMRALELGGAPEQLRTESLQSLHALVRLLPAEGAPRTESVRACLQGICDVLERVLAAPSLVRLIGDDAPLLALADELDELARLTHGVSCRLGLSSELGASTSGHGVRTLAAAIERAVEQGARAGLEVTWETLCYAMRAELPRPFADVVKHALRVLLGAPLVASEPPASAASAPETVPLPAWLPASRFLGDFFVRRALGPAPGVFEFEVVRAAERLNDAAERFVLGVPLYDGHVARALSERDYVHAFMREGEALLGLPTDPHLARVVAFDGSAHPLPLFVCARVEGPTLARLVGRAQLTSERALALMLGILRGLSAMHGAGVAHLGVRPEHVIVKRSDVDVHGLPVLTGYTLSGRHVRPGCAYAPYGAPELWRLSVDADILQAAQVDVYAFGCLAYELLLGERMFGGETDAACIAEHVSHDGQPHRVAVLAQLPHTRPLAEWLTTCLRKRPEDRASVDDLIRTLPSLRALARMPWPVASVPPAP